jgi:hypothetical protein
LGAIVEDVAMALKWKFPEGGGFMVGDSETGLAAYEYPSSPYARLAETEPENMARLIMEMAEANDRYWRKIGVGDSQREAFFNRRKTLLAELVRDGIRPAAVKSGPLRTEERKMATNVLEDPKVVKALAKAEADKVKAVAAETKRVLGLLKDTVTAHVEDAVNAGDKALAKAHKALGAAIKTAIAA